MMKLKTIYNNIINESLFQKMMDNPAEKLPINDPYLANTVRNKHRKLYIDDLLSTGWKTGGMYEKRPQKDINIQYGYHGHGVMFFHNDKIPEVSLGFDNGGATIWIKKDGKRYIQPVIHSYDAYNDIFGSITGNIERTITKGWAKFASVSGGSNLKIEGE